MPSVQSHIITLIREIARVDIDIDEPLMDAGVDSLAAVELHERLRSEFHIEVPPSITFDYPSIRLLSEYVTVQLQDEQVTANKHQLEVPDLPLDPRAQPSSSLGPIATTAITARMSFDTDSESVVPWACPNSVLSPADRWDEGFSLFEQDSTSSRTATLNHNRFGSFIKDVKLFDSDLFGISSNEASLMDPQQRVLLEVACSSISATIASPELRAEQRTSHAVLVGIQHMEYASSVRTHILHASPLLATGVPMSVAAGRLAYAFGFKGAALSVDTACSSSLMAVHLALGSLHHGEALSATAAGVNLMLSAETALTIAAAGMLSLDGRCKALDSSADGHNDDAMQLVCKLSSALMMCWCQCRYQRMYVLPDAAVLELAAEVTRASRRVSEMRALNVAVSEMLFVGQHAASADNTGAMQKTVFDANQPSSALAHHHSVMHMTRVDVSCTEDLASTTSSPYGMRFPIGGIMHTAGILQDAVLANQTAGSIYGVLAPKLDGMAMQDRGTLLRAERYGFGVLTPEQGLSIPAATMTTVSGSATEAALTSAVIRREVLHAVQSTLQMDIDEDAPLMEAGLDSLAAVEVTTMIERSLNVELPVTLVFDYPS
eukprot:gene17252-20526_t